MKCTNCQSTIPDHSTTCPVCGAHTGKDLFADVKQTGNGSGDILLLLLYVSWGVLVNILFFLINKFVFRRMIVSGARRIDIIMSAVDIMITSIDVVFMIVLLFLLKSRRAKGFFIVLLLIRLLLFTLNRMYR